MCSREPALTEEEPMACRRQPVCPHPRTGLRRRQDLQLQRLRCHRQYHLRRRCPCGPLRRRQSTPPAEWKEHAFVRRFENDKGQARPIVARVDVDEGKSEHASVILVLVGHPPRLASCASSPECFDHHHHRHRFRGDRARRLRQRAAAALWPGARRRVPRDEARS